MNATPTDLALAEGIPTRGPSVMSVQWDALQDAAAAVAALAGLAAESPDPQVRDFPRRIREIGGWRLELATDGVSDLAAMMTPGVKALLAVSARGQDPTPAALTLWREYHAARTALMGLIPDNDYAAPLTSA